MWPFTRRWLAPDELVARLQEAENELRNLAGKIKIVERDIDDLHEFYRRLRARVGGDQRAAAASAQAEGRSAPVGDSGASQGHKDELRARAMQGLHRVPVRRPE